MHQNKCPKDRNQPSTTGCPTHNAPSTWIHYFSVTVTSFKFGLKITTLRASTQILSGARLRIGCCAETEKTIKNANLKT